jgi:hypothetical protein
VPFRSKAQQRYLFAAEARGEVPKGTARRWAKETKNIESLPERKMKKEGMFFGDREIAEDGNFMKFAKLGCKSSYGTGEEAKPKPLPTEAPKATPLPTSPPKKPLPLKPEKPIKLAMPFGTGIGVGGSPQFGGSGTAQTQMDQTTAGAGGTPGMGTGEKLKKKLKKQASNDWGDALQGLKESPQRWSDAAAKSVKGVATLSAKGAKALAEADPKVQAAAIGVPAYMMYSKAKKALTPKKKPTEVARLLRKLFTRGR